MAEDQSLLIQKSPLLPYVELRRADHSRACYSAHTHDEFSFGVIDAGQSDYFNSGRRHRVATGGTVCINPGEVHACNPQSGRWSYRMLFIDARQVGQWQRQWGLTGGDYSPFPSALETAPRSFQRIDQLFRLLSEGSDVLEAETCLLQLLQELFSAGNAPAREALDPSGLTRAHELIMDQYDQSLTLEQLAQAAGLSRYHLVRSFKQTYGLPPHAYQLDQRIKRAKALLQAGEPLSQVALRLGFADQAHFQRHFKRRLAVTPKQYQACFMAQPN